MALQRGTSGMTKLIVIGSAIIVGMVLATLAASIALGEVVDAVMVFFGF
jgi:hypothetical protein